MNPLDEVELEQGVRDQAKLIALFFKSLREYGCDRRSALNLTESWIRTTLGQQSG